MTCIGNARKVCPGNPKEYLEEVAERNMTDISRNLKSSGIEAFERFIRFSGSYGILSCEQRMCELLGHCSRFRTPCGTVMWPLALCPSALCRSVLVLLSHWGLQTSKQARELLSVLSCCRTQLSSHHISLCCRRSCLFAGGLFSSGKGLHYHMMKEMSLSSLLSCLLDCNCMEIICALLATSPYPSFILSVDVILHVCFLFHYYCSMCVLGISLVLVY